MISGPTLIRKVNFTPGEEMMEFAAQRQINLRVPEILANIFNAYRLISDDEILELELLLFVDINLTKSSSYITTYHHVIWVKINLFRFQISLTYIGLQ